MSKSKNATNHNNSNAKPMHACMTRASAFENVFSGKRKSIGVRVDTGLYKAVKPILMARYGSVCRPFEAWLAAHLAVASDPASVGNTVTIETLNVLRNLRPRRLASSPNDYGEVVFEDRGSVARCFRCGEPPMFIGYDNGKNIRVFACSRHFVKECFEKDCNGWRQL